MRRNAVLAVLLAAVLALCLFCPGDSAAAVQNYRKRWSSKPPVGAHIAWGSPLAQGLSAVYLMNEGGGNPINLVRRVSATASTALTWAAGKSGTALSFNGTTSSIRETSHVLKSTSYGVTMMVYAYASNWAQSGGLINKSTDQIAWEMFLYSGNNGTVYIRGGGATPLTLQNTTTTGPLTPGWHQVVGTLIGQQAVIFIDGFQRANGTVDALADSSTDLFVGTSWWDATPSGAYWFSGRMECAYVWNRILTAGEIMQLYIDPYAMIQPQSPTWEQYVGFSAAGTGLTRNHSIIMVGP